MLHRLTLVTLLASSLVTLGCSDDTVQTSQLIVRANPDVDFSQFETFTVVTAELAPDAPQPGEDEKFFDDLVNELIMEAMTSEPVCLTFIPPDEVTEENQPDLYAANGLARSEDEGVIWECVGGWWWGYWGWFWDSCLWLSPVPVEWEVGSLLVPVGPPPSEDEEAKPVFTGLAESIVGTGPDVETQVTAAVQAIFQQWPVDNSCPEE